MSAGLRICLLHRPGAASGGDWVALNGYAAALRRAGAELELRAANRAGDLSGFDYAHLWAACSPDWGLPAAQAASDAGARLIVTPFWWSRDERQMSVGRGGEDLAPGYTAAVGETLRLAEVLFAVTMSEAVECWKLAPGAPVWTVPMGIDVPAGLAAQAPEDYVLCVGRREAHKNQAALARACAVLGYDVVFAQGQMSAAEKWARLARARVHALPSFFENPGLAHGEALALGIPAVMGCHGCEPEFYGPGPFYCDPTEGDDITRALAAAWQARRCPPRMDLPTWDDAAARALAWMQTHQLEHA